MSTYTASSNNLMTFLIPTKTQRQDYLFRELMKLEASFENVRLSRNRYATIWGGASLLKVLLNSMHDLLTMSGWSSAWDYVINLSESDFPIK